MTRGRTFVALGAEVALTLGVAVLLGAVWQWFLTGDLTAALPEGAWLLFFFMDVGLVIWVGALVVVAVRRRSLPGVGITFLWALVGVGVNAVVVLVVGLLQGGWAALFVLFALEAGVAFLVAVLIVAPIARRLVRGVPSSRRSPPPSEVGA
jgi:hypothetical protein